jgi:NadR type nicotinamide-nucleotide adenylyltransferase
MKKIVIIGPESTGKSTLSEQLANHYGTCWCPEYAREYLMKLEGKYTYDDLLTIAKGQAEQEDSLLANASNGFYFIDTEMYVMKVWCEVAFENCHTWIMKQAARRSYSLYLLCDVDLPWKPDALREYPDLPMRQRLFKMYKDIMVNQDTAWGLISGTNEQRLNSAVSLIDSFFKRN